MNDFGRVVVVLRFSATNTAHWFDLDLELAEKIPAF
jgi:hypothetical protein